MIPHIFVALLLTTALGAEYDLRGDANIYAHVLTSMASAPVLQRASSVCYDDLGCFDKEGTFKHLKQLPEPPETVNTQFLLYTRRNRLQPQMLDHRKPDTIRASHFDPNNPLKFVTHGFGGRNNLTWVWQMKNALLEMHDLNIVVVDWSLGARAPYYIQAAVNAELVGAEIAVMYYAIKDQLGVAEDRLHLIGFSLGAHVMGFAGKRMQEIRGTKPARITGLDPASPLFEEYGGGVHLWRDDAELVDVVHTNADLLLYGGVGIGAPLGHVDFFPNGGKRQPGCGSTLKGAFVDLFGGDRERTCNHERAVHLFTDSVLRGADCALHAFPCTNWTEFAAARCLSCPGDACGRMGFDVRGEGTFYLVTTDRTPFCADPATLNVRFANDVKKSYGAIIVTLEGQGGRLQNVTLSEKDEKLVGGDSRTAVVALGDGMLPLVTASALYLRYNGWITKGAKTFAIAQVSMRDARGGTVFETCAGTTVTLEDKTFKNLDACAQQK